MTRLPLPYPHQVVADWIAANDDHAHAPVLSVVRTPRNFTPVDGPSPLDYDVATRRAQKAQAEAVAQVFSALGRVIKRLWVTTLPSLMDSFRSHLKASHEKRRAIAALSNLSTHELKDIGLTATDVAAARSGQVTLTELNEIRRSGWPY